MSQIVERETMTKSTTSTKSTRQSRTDDPLAPYLTIAREGDSDSPAIEQRFWIGSLALTNASVPIYAKSRADVEARAKELLAAHGVEV